MPYDELIKNLRHDSASALQNCEFDFVHAWMLEAADAIEGLLSFAHFVAREAVVSDEEWENNNRYAFPEIASRKLNKLGIVERNGGFWNYEPPESEEQNG